MRDKVFQALKRFKWCKKIINVILSECTFDDGIEKVQEILRNNAKCKFNQSSIGVKRQVIKILDSHNRVAMILSFDRLQRGIQKFLLFFEIFKEVSILIL